VQVEPLELKLYWKKRIFNIKGPSQGQVPGLLCLGSASAEKYDIGSFKQTNFKYFFAVGKKTIVIKS